MPPPLLGPDQVIPGISPINGQLGIPALVFAEAQRLLSQPLAISLMGEQQLRAMLPTALNTRDGGPLKGAPTATTRGRVALVPVQGPLSCRDSWLNRFFGWSSYETVARDFLAACENDDIGAIVLDIDSPGGDATGCGELSKLIAGARGRKPIVAYCGGAMCSAAYWLGSAADRIVTDPSGMLGSIGVRTVMV